LHCHDSTRLALQYAAVPLRRVYSPFVRKQRAAARVALYLSLAIVAIGGYAGRKFLSRPRLGEQRWMKVDWAKVPEVDLLRRYIRIDTTRDTGDEAAAVRFLASELAAFGVPSTVEVLPGGSANLWAIVEGQDPKAIVLHQHVDTDPVPDPSIWERGPWSADIEGPWLHGRGAFDMKAVGIAQLIALRRLVASGRPLRRSVIFLATSSEEHGSDLGMRWILHAHPDLAARFGVLLTEGGAVEARSPDDIKYWGTDTAQRRNVIATFCSTSRERLEDLKADIALAAPRPRLTPSVERFFAVYGPHRDARPIRELLSRPRALVDDPFAFASLPRYLQSMLIDQAYPQDIVEDSGGNRLEVRLLLLPGVSLEEGRTELLPDWMTYRVTASWREPSAPNPGSPTDDPTFQAILGVLQAHFPGVPVGPWLPDGSITDARFVRPLGVPAYGFSPFLVLSTDTLHIGRLNERIDLPGFVQGVEVYSDVLDRLAQ
jgi:acetylornithine deacetylase/succinyl-diaminopimelate desuccinylase-like protein